MSECAVVLKGACPRGNCSSTQLSFRVADRGVVVLLDSSPIGVVIPGGVALTPFYYYLNKLNC